MKVNKCKLILVKEKEIEYEKLNSSTAVYEFLVNQLKINKEPEEVMILLALDNQNKLICCCEVAHGSLDKAVLSPRDVYKRALVANAKSIIIAHNHPSGNELPSFADKLITTSLRDAGTILDVKLLDHIIVGDKTYYSFYEKNPNLVFSEECSNLYNQHKVKKQTATERSI